jgi:hypothetical protein
MKKLDEYILGESTSDAIRVETRQENMDAALLLVKQCKLKLAIISHQLDPFVYDQAEFVEAIRQLALKGRHVDIRIIASEPTLIIRRGHKLVNLAGKISSYIEIRKPSSQYIKFSKAVLIADEVGYLFRESEERYTGTVNFNGRRGSKNMLKVFDRMWATSESDPNFRRILI